MGFGEILMHPVNQRGDEAPQLALDFGFALYIAAFLWLDMVWEVSLGIAVFTYLLAITGNAPSAFWHPSSSSPIACSILGSCKSVPSWARMRYLEPISLDPQHVHPDHPVRAAGFLRNPVATLVARTAAPRLGSGYQAQGTE